jgi:hypothetical protein
LHFAANQWRGFPLGEPQNAKDGHFLPGKGHPKFGNAPNLQVKIFLHCQET